MQIPNNLTKLYYTMGEVAEMFDVNPSLLRYWDKEFKLLKLKKNRKGDRRFMVKDIELVAQIYTLVKERGFTLDGAKLELSTITQPNEPIPLGPQLLSLKEELLKIKSHLKSIRDNIA